MASCTEIGAMVTKRRTWNHIHFITNANLRPKIDELTTHHFLHYQFIEKYVNKNVNSSSFKF